MSRSDLKKRGIGNIIRNLAKIQMSPKHVLPPWEQSEEIGRSQFNLATPTYLRDRCIQRTVNTVWFINETHLTLVLLRGCCNKPPNSQVSPRCSKSRSQGLKLLRIPSSSSFPFILAKKFQTYHLYRVYGKLSKLDGQGVGATPWFLNWIYFENIWNGMHSKLSLQVRMAIF